MIAKIIKIGLLGPFLTYFGLSIAFSQPANLHQIGSNSERADSLKHDFSVFRKLLITNHPSLHRYIQPARLNYLLDSCYAVLNSESTGMDLLRSVKYVLSAGQDGHLYGGPSPSLRKQLEENSRFFPIQLHFIHDSAYVSVKNPHDIPVGARIVSIDHESIPAIQAKLFQLIVSDGAIQTKKRIILDNTFFFYYLLAYGEKPAFDVHYTTADGRLKVRHVQALLKRNFPEAKTSPQKVPLALSMHGKVALLSIRSFDSTDIQRARYDFGEFLKQSFTKIKSNNITDLIIDLRDNGGGRDLYGSLLYTFLATEPFRYYERLNTITDNLPYPQFTSPGSSFNNLSRSMLLKDDSTGYVLDERSHLNLKLLSPDPNAYGGRVWIVTNGQTFSTAAEFCSIVRSNNRGKFIGEETGGAYVGNTSGSSMESELPFSKIQISIPLVGYSMAVKPESVKDRGIMPDYPVQPSLSEFIRGEDVVLKHAFKIVRAAASLH